jgi:anaerobic selenocysteine-containing dehydrogenase
LLGEDAVDARFFNRLGASELLKTICAAPTGTVYRAMYGAMGGVPPQDYSRARAIVLWGVNPSATSIHLAQHVIEARRNGAFVAVVDPRRTPLARSARVHLRPLPGTDVVLALAMIGELIRTGRADGRFLDRHTRGFDELARAANDYSLARAAAECDVPQSDVAAVVDAYAAASPAVIRCGWGVERNRNGGNAVRAILSLPAVAGKFGVRGGGVTMSMSRAFPLNPIKLARPDLRRLPPRQVNMVQLGRFLTEPQDPPVRALFVYNSNPAAVTPDQGRVLRGLARDDLFTVVHEQVTTDTARYADVLLPATTAFEQAELHRSYGHYFLQYADPVIAPVGESLTNVELFSRLARRMGFEEPELSPSLDDLLDDATDGARTRVASIDARRVVAERVVPLRFEGRTELIQFVNDLPTTPEQRIELAPPQLGTFRYEAVSQERSFALLSPASSKLISSTFGEFNLPEARLAMHPDDARRLHLREDDAVRVFNQLGEVHVRLNVTDEVRVGVVSLPKGAWRKSTLNGATSTALIADRLTDIGDGACFNDARVDVARLETDALRRT